MERKNLYLNPAVVRAQRTLRQVQIQGGTRISAQVYCRYIEHEIREADTVDVPVSAFECRLTAGFRLYILEPFMELKGIVR